MRCSVYLALAVGVALAGCGAGPQAAASGTHYVISKHAAVPNNLCSPDQFAFCITISPKTTGPYWGWCGNVSCYGAQYEMVATSEIVDTKTGRSANKKLPQSFSPSPGNPTWLYITEVKPIRRARRPKFTLISSACEYSHPSTCYGPIKIGIVPGP
ncbi:MAG: hypothetical protein WBE79_04830 [Candidatus Cybelea sp.]